MMFNDSCNIGFHACENPIECLKFYNPNEPVYHEVELGGEIDKSIDNTKVAAIEKARGDGQMTRLRRSECSVLPLVLKGRWYDMIASGEKREEYRDAKAYWDVRLAKWLRSLDEGDKHPIVGFSRGYKRPDMFFTVRRVFKRTTALHEEWGEPNGDHHVISLGFRIEFSN